MARSLSRAVAALLALAAAPVTRATCVIDQSGEITNPFAPGCGDFVFTYTVNDNIGSNIALGFAPPLPVASLTPVDGFRDYASLLARHQSLAMLHDEVTGQAVGQTLAGRDIWAYAVSDLDTTTVEGFAEGAVLVNGGIHAREWQTPEAVTGLFEALVAGKTDDGLIQYLVENLNTVLVPVNNVDGFIQTQLFPVTVTAHRAQPREGRMRRKNLRNPVTQGIVDSNIATVADNFWGLDLNRNSTQGFGLANRSSNSVTSLIYRGPASTSEPELLALQNAATLGPAARLRLFSDTHSFGQVYFAPTTANGRRNAITNTLAARMSAASQRSYAVSPDPAGSQGIGTIADHFAFTYQIPAWTMELEPLNGGQDYGGLATHGHSGFILPDDQATRMRADVARQYLLGFYRQSGPPVAIAAQIRDMPSGGVVYEASWQMSSATARTLAVGSNEALIPGRDYRLWVAFNKPMRIRDSNGAVIPYAGQSVGDTIGVVTLEIPTAAGQNVSLQANAAWLGTAGGAPNGFLRYRDDAFAVDFTLPAGIAVTAATPAVISLSLTDFAQMSLDADPATAVDWGGGAWLRYENAQGVAGDVGGVSCAFRPFIAPQANTTPPPMNAACAAAAPPSPPPPSPPNNRGGGGGGASLELLGFLLGLLALQRRLFGAPDGAQ
jgi:hypothetical protein